MMALSAPLAAGYRERRPVSPAGGRTALLLRLIWLEARHGHAIWLVPMMVAAGVWFAVEYSRVDLLFWDQVSANIALTFVLIGPVCSGWGAWLAGRESRRRMAELFSASPTTCGERDVVVFGTPMIGAVVAYGLTALIVSGYTATYATWGGPSPSVISFGGLLSAAMALCGSIFGRVWPARIAPFVAALAPLLYTMLTYSYFRTWDDPRWLAPYAYIMDWKGRPLELLTESTWANYHGSLLGGTLATLGVVSFAASLLLGVRYRRRLVVATGVVAVALLFAASAESGRDVPEVPPETYSGPEAVENPPLTCAGDVVETCLHQVYEPELGEVAARVDALFAPIAGLPGVPERVEQRADLESTETVLRFDAIWTFDMLPEHSASFNLLWPTISRTWEPADGLALDAPQHAISRWLAMGAGYNSYYANAVAEIEDPFRRAAEQQPVDGPAVFTLSADVRNAYFDELAAYNEEVRAAAERFGALSPDERRAWLEANWDALRSGKLTLEEMP